MRDEVLGRINRETWIGYMQLALICTPVLFGLWFGGERLIVQQFQIAEVCQPPNSGW